MFSFGGYDGLSPIAKESEQTALVRQQNALIAEQNRILSGSGSTGERICAACGKPMMASSAKFPPFVHARNGKLECP